MELKTDIDLTSILLVVLVIFVIFQQCSQDEPDLEPLQRQNQVIDQKVDSLRGYIDSLKYEIHIKDTTIYEVRNNYYEISKGIDSIKHPDSVYDYIRRQLQRLGSPSFRRYDR